MPEFTERQREAIRTLDRSLLVSAGAGSGKTSVLVQRFLRMVAGSESPDDPEPPSAPVDGVLTITFTEKAAGEMRERISRALTERGLVAERRALEVAYISTIHAFCGRLLRENPFEAGIDPKFTVLEGAPATLLREDALERAVEEVFASGDRELVEFLLSYQEASGVSADDPLASPREPILEAIEAMRAQGWGVSDLARWLACGPTAIEQQTAIAVQAALADIWRGVRDLARPLRDVRLVGPAEEARRTLSEWAQEAAPFVGQESLASLCERAESLRRLGVATRYLPRRREYDFAGYEALREAQKAIAPLIADRLVQELTWEREEQAARCSYAFLRLAYEVWRTYESLKDDLSSLDFSDLQQRALHLLEHSEGVRQRYRRKFRYVMVDEFQDTDVLQKRILDQLAGEDNCFVVGDVKQSIYGWRNADVRLFLDLERQFAERERAEPGSCRRISLAENFRSRPEVLALVNAVFSDLWPSGPPGGLPGEPDAGPLPNGLPNGEAPLSATTPFEALEARASYGPKEVPSIELLLVPAGKADGVRALEAELLACRLKEIHGDSAADGQAPRRDSGPLYLTSAARRGEKVAWRDCLILFRSLLSLAAYEDALVRHGIPYFVVGGRGYYARREIRDLVCLLRVIASPLDDVATAALLRSPFVGASLDALAVLGRTRHEVLGYPSLYRGIPAACEDPDMPDEDRDALRRFYDLVERLRAKADRVKVGWLLDEALGASHYDARVLARPDGRRRLANVRKLIHIANAYSAPDVGGLVRYLESLSEVRAEEGDAPSYSEASDVVRVMTVHRAKGLEAPVVCLPGLGRRIRSSDPKLVDVDAGRRLIGLKVAHEGEWVPSAALSLLSDERAQRERAEEQRLLYVAMTRAQEHLILVGPMPPGGDTWGSWLYGTRPPVAGPPEAPIVAEMPGWPGFTVRVSGPRQAPSG